MSTGSELQFPERVRALTPAQRANLVSAWCCVLYALDDSADDSLLQGQPAAIATYAKSLRTELRAGSGPTDTQKPLQRRMTGWQTLTKPQDSAVLTDANLAISSSAATNSRPSMMARMMTTLGRAESRLNLDVSTFSCPVPLLRPELFRGLAAEHPDVYMLRFLRARKWDVEKAVDMLIGTLKWKVKAAFPAFFRDMERLVGEKTLKSEKGYMIPGRDKEGRPIAVVHIAKHHPKETTLLESKRLALYMVENARLFLKSPAEALTIIVDFHGFSLSNVDMEMAKFLAGAMEAYYPESLGTSLLVDPPFIFKGVWAIVKGWLDPVVASKIQFISRKQLHDFVAPEVIPKALGGPAKDHVWIPPASWAPRGEPDEKEVEATEKWTASYENFWEQTRKWVASQGSEETSRIRQEAAVELGKLADEAQRCWVGDTVYYRAKELPLQ